MKTQYTATSGHAEQTLTEIEALGLASRFDLANGHASHELTLTQQRIIDRLPKIWEHGTRQKSRDAEMMFKHAFMKLSGTPSLAEYEYFKICPTASNSIDVAAAWLAAHKMKTALIEPTFDNLYLILKRRGVELTALAEDVLHSAGYEDVLNNVDAVFLVNPNNPTGKIISHALYAHFIHWCAKNNKMIILDNSFRFFIPQDVDVYQLLLDSGVRFISLEDTGKVWPTQEIKASLLFTSQDIFNEIDLIYDEIFLCHSNFSLGILTAFLEDASERGLEDAVWKEVAIRRKRLRTALDGEVLSVHASSLKSVISVEWVRINHYFNSDVHLAEHFREQHLILLPGRQFYWNHKGNFVKSDSVRFALMKLEHEFDVAIHYLQQELRRIARWTTLSAMML